MREGSMRERVAPPDHSFSMSWNVVQCEMQVLPMSEASTAIAECEKAAKQVQEVRWPTLHALWEV